MPIVSLIFYVALVGVWLMAIVNFAGRQRNLERKVNLILAKLDIDPMSSVVPSERVRILAADPDQKVAAIKAYREETGADLAEAAAVIEAFREKLRPTRA